VAAGREVSAAASNLSALVAARSIALNRGPDVVDATAGLAPALDQAASALNRSVSDLAGYDRPYLWPSLGATVRDFRATVIAAATKASTAATVARALPALLGGSGTRHYFLALEDNAELRGGGGLVRYWGEIEAAGGQLRLTRFGTVDDLNRAATGSAATRASVAPDGFLDRYGQFDPTNTWQNVNVSPDFAVTGQVIAGLYPQSGGETVDGVLAVDIPGLAALVGLSGPVRVDGWPEPVTATNLALVILHDAAVRFPADTERQAFLAGLYRRTVESVLASGLGTPAQLTRALGAAVEGGHVLLYGADADEEGVFDRLGAAGRLAPVTGDSVLVVNQNLTGARIDAQLARSVSYDVHLDPGTQPASATAHVAVTLDNAAAADNRTYLSIYSPLPLTHAQPGMTTAAELGRRAYSSIVAIPAGSSRSVGLDVEGRVALEAGNWYSLGLPHQPSLTPERTEVRISVPVGWRIADVRGPIGTVDDRHAVAQLNVSSTQQVAVRLERTAWSRLWERLRP
jgi:hypothetical protein